jgi:hypothetical protein
MTLIANAPATLSEAPLFSLVAAFGVSDFDVLLPVFVCCVSLPC